MMTTRELLQAAAASSSTCASLQPPASTAARRSLAAALLCALLAACGGGGSDGSDSTTTSGTTSGTTTTVTAPTITTSPASASVTTGASASFSVVAATGGGTLSYQWYRNGTAISGATAASYTIATTATSDAGTYYVVVTNSAGSATSANATLTATAAGGGSTGGGGTTPTSGWTLATGANPADLIESYSFPYTVSIALGDLSITTSSSRLVVGTASGGVTPITLDGTRVITVTRDTLGLTIDSDLPEGSNLTLALSGTFAGSVTVYSDSVLRLALNGTTLNSPNGPALNLQYGQRSFVVLGDGSSNVLTDTSTYSARTLPGGSAMDLKAALFAEGALIFSGGGSLNVTSAAKHAIASDEHVRVRSGTLTVTANAKDGVRANDAFVMDGGTLTVATANAAGKGIKVEGKEDSTAPIGFVAINGGTIDINSYDKAITASWESAEDGDTATLTDDPDPRVTINGGTITIRTFGTPFEDTNLTDGDSSLSPEGIEAKSVLTINDGSLTIDTTDDALNAGTGIVINGGRIYARATANDAIDSNGYLTIAGGVVVADGAGGAEGGLDCDNNTFTVTGGTFVGIGGRNSTPTRSASTQNSVLLSNGAANTLLVIRNASGGVAFAFTIPKASQAMLLGAPTLATGTAYTVYTGGTLAGYTENFHGLYLGATTHSGGTAGRSFTISTSVTTP